MFLGLLEPPSYSLARIDAAQLVRYVQADGPACRPLLVTGDALPACQALLAATLPSFGGCVVHLQGTQEPLLGFDDAPLMGTLTRKDGHVETELLEAVLEHRIVGRFHLALPAQRLVDLDIDDLLNQTLLAGALHLRAKQHHLALPPLTIALDNWRPWLPEVLLGRLLDQARAFQFRVVLADEAWRTAGYLGKMTHLVALSTRTRAVCLPFGQEALVHLPDNTALYLRDDRDGQAPTVRTIHW